jgi:5-methylcytosine-specific restriction endonuclease McrA
MPKLYSRKCNQCGRPYQGQGRTFCSISCRTTWRNLHENPAQTQAAREKIAASRRGKPTTLGLPCPPAKRRKISRALKGRRLSPEHCLAIAHAVRAAGNRPPRNPHLVGPAHPNWKGGHSPARVSDYQSPRYREFRKAVLDRDRWRCQDCDTKKDLQAHHILPWGPYPDLRYAVENAVTLCLSCHKRRHRGVPRPVTVDGRTLADRRSDQVVSP